MAPGRPRENLVAGYWMVLKAMLRRRAVAMTRARMHPTSAYAARRGLARVIRERLELVRPRHLPD